MGLRGLAYPCSIAQLIAIFIMALIRAIVRRRLGKIPIHTSASANYELDFLATQIVFRPNFRTLDKFAKHSKVNVRELSPLQWKIREPEAGHCKPFLFRTRPLQNTAAIQRLDSNLDQKTSSTADVPASSQQLLRVRERLGDLCTWQSKALESSRSLVQSIELFLDTFFPSQNDEQRVGRSGKKLDVLDWCLEAIRPPTSDMSPQEPDWISIHAERSSAGDWQVDIGRIDALISLWMASTEAKATQDQSSSPVDKTSSKATKLRESPNWRLAQSGKDMKHSFCRIIGDNLEDGILKRDVAWWVDELIADQSDSQVGDEYDKRPDGAGLKVRGVSRQLMAGKSIPGPRWQCSRERSEARGLVIGFNGRRENGKYHTE
jgi:hypothetical protein